MNSEFYKTCILVLAAPILMFGCATIPEAKNTAALVSQYSQKINNDLQYYEQSLQEARSKRSAEMSELTNKAQYYKSYISERERGWTISGNKTAENLFKSLLNSRLEPVELKLVIPSVSENAKSAKLYDAANLENVIKQVQKLTREESLEDRLKFSFEYAKQIANDLDDKNGDGKKQNDIGSLDSVVDISNLLNQLK